MCNTKCLRQRSRWSVAAITGLVMALSVEQAVMSQTRTGHRVTNRRVTVDRQEHWQRWYVPSHAVKVHEDGWVRPHFSRNRYNVLADLETFTRVLPDFKPKRGQTTVLNLDSTETLDVGGNVITQKKKGKQVPVYTYFLRPGISRVGSNPSQAANILDGDPSTYWEPDPADPLENWWIEVDLGRVVPVDSLLVHFVEEGQGDPFRQFRLITAPFQKPSNKDIDGIRYEILDGTRAPNEDQRTFSFELTQLKADPNWTGKLIEIVRLVVTDSKLDKGRVVSEAEWKALDSSERGAIVYHVRNQQGFEEPLDKADYEQLSADRQGRVEYYIRERPRLADIEVWGYGDNISPGIMSGGGSAGFYGSQDNFSPGAAFDGDAGSNLRHLVWSPVVDRGVLIVDIGATFWMDTFRMSSVAPNTLIDGYRIRSSDGSRDSSGKLKWRRLSHRDREHNLTNRYENIMDVYPEGTKLRFMEVSIVSDEASRRGGYSTGPSISEYQLFSRGYPAEAVLTSDLIELPATRNFGEISWESDVMPGSSLEIRTRTGDLLGKIIRYFDKGGTEITYDAWNNLLGSFKGPADTTFVPTAGWSPWSRPYQASGDVVSSPGLRNYLEIEVRLSATDRDAAASIRSIDIELVSPVAQRVLAELWPVEVHQAGEVDTFDVYVEPYFIEKPTRSRSIGFDEIRFALPGVQGVELLELGLEAGEDEAERVFQPTTVLGIYRDANDADVQVTYSESGDSLRVLFDAPLNILPEKPRIYNRITSEGEQVPVSQDGQLLSGASYGVLDEEERGEILYFRQRPNNADALQLEPVSRTEYLALEEVERGPIRYFRILRGDGAQFAFDAGGDSLDLTAYNGLSSRVRGSAMGRGNRLRARIKAPVFLNGTTLEMAVRNSNGGATAPWQMVEAGDASDLVDGNTLSIGVPLMVEPIDQLHVSPNPFTPNGDGINDAAEIRFSVFRITADRRVSVRIHNLNGSLVWQNDHHTASGRALVQWDGSDGKGRKVPPGIYLCSIELDVDHEPESAMVSRLISVAY